MKKLHILYDIEVVITYNEYVNTSIAAAKTKNSSYTGTRVLPPSPINVDEDTQMYADFETFLSRALRIFNKMGFTVNREDTHFSDKSNTTYYVTAIHPALGETIRCVFYLRISTHSMKQDEEVLIDRNEYFDSHTAELYGEGIEWKLEEVRVNNKTCSSYKVGEMLVSDKLDSWIDEIVKMNHL